MSSSVTAETKLQPANQYWLVRAMEIFPGFMTWSFLLGPIILSIISPVLVAYFIIAFDLFWLVKSMRLSLNLIRGYSKLYRNQKIDWLERLNELKDVSESLKLAQQKLKVYEDREPRLRHPWLAGLLGGVSLRGLQLRQHVKELEELEGRKSAIMDPDNIYNAVIIATYNESLEVLEPSVQAIMSSNYPTKQMMLVIAYEERGGPKTADNANYLIKQYGSKFGHAMAIMHPDGLAGEAKVKGANISYAGRQLTRYITEQKIDPEQIIVTTFDSDHRPSPNYFAYLSYSYAININRVRKSYQPIPMFYNNIWDAPAPMRIISTGNSFWIIMEAMRPRRLRNFAAHAQSLKALIDTDYWSVTSIVEDGHQYWRTYFTYDGDHEVVPIFTPVYQDAVLAKTYFKTFVAQYVQLRRWAWGASDLAYVVTHCRRNPRIRLSQKLLQIARLIEGYFSWATAPLILTFVAWLPLFLNRHSNEYLANQLPVIASNILTLTTLGLVTTALVSLLSLPPKPARYHRGRFISMVAQWALLPVVAIVFSSFAAIDSQTRLMFGRYLDWRVTEKATRK